MTSIWIISQDAVTPNQPGGTRHYSLAKYLADKGYKVTVIAANFKHFAKSTIHKQQPKTLRESIDGIDWIWVKVPHYNKSNLKRLLSMHTFAIRIYSTLSRLNEKPNLIIGSSPPIFSAFTAYLISKRKRVNFIYEIRDFWPEALMQSGQLKRTHPLILLTRSINRILIQKSKTIISPLPGIRDYLKAKQIDTNTVNIRWLPNFVDLSLINERRAGCFQDSTQPFTIMYTGSLNLSNDLFTLLKAAKAIHDKGYQKKILFRIIGDGPQKNKLLAFCNINKLNNVQIEPHTSKLEIYKKLQQADACILLQYPHPVYQWGTSPWKLPDYMATEKPIIFASDDPYMREILIKNQVGICTRPQQVEEIAAAILKIFHMNTEQRVKLGKNAKELAERQFSQNQVCSELQDLIEETLTRFA